MDDFFDTNEEMTSNDANIDSDIDMDLDNIPRCPECNLISSLKLHYKEGKPYIKYYCENKHNGEISLGEYIQKYNSHSLLKEKCQECNKSQNEVKGDYLYCCKCNKFLCNICIVNHPNNENHDTINFKKYDSFCKIHSNSFSIYCSKCKQNLCLFCKNKHESHELIDLSKYNYSFQPKNKFEDIIKNLEKKIEDLDIIKQNISSEIDKVKKFSEMEIKFFTLLVNTFNYESSRNNINYNVIQNLKNFDEIFLKKIIRIYEKIYDEGNKYISFIQNASQNINQPNNMKCNFKTLNNHTNTIVQLSILKDGRLISCSGDCTINIYKENSYELQLSIKEHTSFIYFFTQLHNDKLITCSADKTMNIINLDKNDKYILEQKLLGHTHYINKAIEIRINEIISVSNDKTMKKWELKNDNKYVCIKTIVFQNSVSHCNILKLNENEFITSSVNDKCLKFWNSYDNTKISTINNIETEWTSGTLYLLNDEILCVCGSNSKGFYLIKISTHQIIKNIFGPQTIFSIYQCYDGLLLCSVRNKNGNSALIKYKYENHNMNKIIEKDKVHKGDIYTCIELNDGIIASGGEDKLIKLWGNY